LKTCNGCKFADWKKTDGGKLHPSGDGRCTYEYKVPELPACMYWINEQKPCGGRINRRVELKDHCAYYNRV